MIKNCPMRHENGNCIPAGGFCTANKNICEALLNAYRMGKTQLSQEGTTFDTISRQQAIDEIKNYCKNGCDIAEDNWCPSCQREQFIKLLKALPSVQPQSTTGQLNDGAQSTAQSTDLIDRQAARHALCKAVHKGEDIPCENQTASCLWTGTRVCDFVREIDALPTIQPERKKGEWLPDNNNAYEMRFVCSCCKESEVVPTIGFTKYKPLWDFCPNCGADMRGEKDG